MFLGSESIGPDHVHGIEIPDLVDRISMVYANRNDAPGHTRTCSIPELKTAQTRTRACANRWLAYDLNRC